MNLAPAFNPQISGTLTVTETKPFAITPANSSNFVIPGASFNVEIELQLAGLAAGASALVSSLQFQVFASLIGGAPGGNSLIGQVTLATPNDLPFGYDAVIPCTAPLPVGLYSVTVVVTSFITGSPSTPWLVAGFDEILVQVTNL